MIIKFYKFSKQKNSTKQPTGGVEYNCLLKDGANMLNPTIQLKLPEFINYNYAYIAEFERYYYVGDWNYNKGFWTAILSVDVLSSHKDSIKNSTMYVLRSASNFDGSIMDTLYPTTGETIIFNQERTSPWDLSIGNSSSFVIGIAGDSVNYVAFNMVSMEYLFRQMFNDNFLESLIGDWKNVFPEAKAVTNPFQYITSVLWMPFEVVGHSMPNLKVGYVEMGVASNGQIYADETKVFTENFTLQRHPKSASRGSYLNNAPYSSYRLFFPPFGTINLDADICANSDRIEVEIVVDLKTGMASMYVYANGNSRFLLTILSAPVGIPYQVSQVLNREVGAGYMLQSVAGSIGSIANPIGAFGNALSAIGDVVNSKIPTVNSIGNMGGINALQGNPSLIYEFQSIVDDDIIHNGRPLCMDVSLGTLSGYVLTSKASIELHATDTEINQINSLLDSGIYIE